MILYKLLHNTNMRWSTSLTSLWNFSFQNLLCQLKNSLPRCWIKFCDGDIFQLPHQQLKLEPPGTHSIDGWTSKKPLGVMGQQWLVSMLATENACEKPDQFNRPCIPKMLYSISLQWHWHCCAIQLIFQFFLQKTLNWFCRFS